MQQIYSRTPLRKFAFNKIALQLYWNRTSAWVFSCKFVTYFQNTFSTEHLWTVSYDIIRCFKNITITPVFRLKLIFFKQNKLNKDLRKVSIRAFNWNLKNVVPLYTSYSFKRNKRKRYKETKLPWEYKRAMQSLFTDNTVLCLCRRYQAK